jgi:uncharacterized protein
MIRAVIDTNCLLASISPRSAGYGLYRAFDAEQFEWVVSNEILTEYAELLTQKYSVKTAQLVLEILTLAPNTRFQEAYYRWQLIEADPDDNKFVDVAIAAGVTVLVTNDGHFDVLKAIDFPTVPVLSLAQFLRLLA